MKKDKNKAIEELKEYLCINCQSIFLAYSANIKKEGKINTDVCLNCNSGTGSSEVKIGKVEAFYTKQSKIKNGG